MEDMTQIVIALMVFIGVMTALFAIGTELVWGLVFYSIISAVSLATAVYLGLGLVTT